MKTTALSLLAAALLGCVPPPSAECTGDLRSAQVQIRRGWEPLSGEFDSDPSITASGSRLDVFATAGGRIHHRWWDGARWNPAGDAWEPLGNDGHDVGAPAAVSVGGRIEVFATENDTGHVIHRELSADWSPWEDLGGNAVGKPTVVVKHVHLPGPGNRGFIDEDVIDVFTMNTDHTLALTAGRGAGRFHWRRNLGGHLASPPAAVSWGDNRIDVLVRGADDHVFHLSSTPEHRFIPGGFEDLGGSAATTPAVASWGPDRIDVVVTSIDATIHHRAWTGSEWTPWESVAGVSALHDEGQGYAAPAAIAHGTGGLDLLVVGRDRSVWHTTLTGSTWAPWTPIADCAEAPIPKGSISPIATPAVVSPDGVRWDVVFTGADRGIWHGISGRTG